MRSCRSTGTASHLPLVLPLLQQQHRAGSAGNTFGQQCVDRRVEQLRVLRAIDEAGEIAIVTIRPARSLFPERGQSGEVIYDRVRHIEDHVIRAAR